MRARLLPIHQGCCKKPIIRMTYAALLPLAPLLPEQMILSRRSTHFKIHFCCARACVARGSPICARRSTRLCCARFTYFGAARCRTLYLIPLHTEETILCLHVFLRRSPHPCWTYRNGVPHVCEVCHIHSNEDYV